MSLFVRIGSFIPAVVLAALVTGCAAPAYYAYPQDQAPAQPQQAANGGVKHCSLDANGVRQCVIERTAPAAGFQQQPSVAPSMMVASPYYCLWIDPVASVLMGRPMCGRWAFRGPYDYGYGYGYGSPRVIIRIGGGHGGHGRGSHGHRGH